VHAKQLLHPLLLLLLLLLLCDATQSSGSGPLLDLTSACQ
jgi:hypothetical protein